MIKKTGRIYSEPRFHSGQGEKKSWEVVSFGVLITKVKKKQGLDDEFTSEFISCFSFDDAVVRALRKFPSGSDKAWQVSVGISDMQPEAWMKEGEEKKMIKYAVDFISFIKEVDRNQQQGGQQGGYQKPAQQSQGGYKKQAQAAYNGNQGQQQSYAQQSQHNNGGAGYDDIPF